MVEHGLGSCLAELEWEDPVTIYMLDEVMSGVALVGRVGRHILQVLHDLTLAFEAMLYVLSHHAPTVSENRPVSWTDGRPLRGVVSQPLEGSHVGAHVTPVGGDDDGAGAEHAVSREENALLF